MTGSPLYDQIGDGYQRTRRPDPRIARAIREALGDVATVVNVGAGTGSYEPSDLDVTAVEPSARMIINRPKDAAPCVQARAERLPFDDDAFDAAMATLTVHHWDDLDAGLAEMRRVSRDAAVILTWDPGHDGFWLVQDYLPEILEVDRRIFPPLERLVADADRAEVRPLPVPADCVDGFLGAWWARPEAFLDPVVRAGISTFVRVPDCGEALARLRRDLEDGTWDARHGHLRMRDALDVGYRLVVLTGHA